MCIRYYRVYNNIIRINIDYKVLKWIRGNVGNLFTAH